MATNPHPGNNYYANPVTGTIQRQSNPLLAAALVASGYQGPSDFATAQATLKFIRATGALSPINAPAAAANAAKAIAKAVTNPLDWLSNVGNFFDKLSQAATWIRVAEFVLGGALVLVGVAHLAKGTPVGQAAAKAVKTAGIAAAL